MKNGRNDGKTGAHRVMGHRSMGLVFGLMLFGLSAHAGQPEGIPVGMAALEKWDHAEAMAVFNRVLREKNLPPEQRAAAFAGRCAASHQQQIGRKNVSRALADCNQAMALQSDHAPAYRWRGMVLLASAKPAQAVADLNVAIALDPKDYQALQCRGAARIRLNQWAAALEDLNAAIHLNADHPDSYYYRGQLQAMQNNQDQAVADFTVFLQRMQQDEALYQRVEKSRLLQGGDPLVRAALQKALAMQPPRAVASPAPHEKPRAPAGEPPAEALQDLLSAVIDASEQPTAVDPDRAESGKRRVRTPHVKGKFAFKVESFRESANADKALASATRLKLPVYVETVEVNQLTHIRVWVGPFGSDAAAETARRKMMEDGYHPGVVSQF